MWALLTHVLSQLLNVQYLFNFTGGEDFTPVIMNVTFQIGETLKNVTVPIIPDLIIEENERFYVQVESLDGQPNSISKPDGAWVTIIDDDILG